MVDYEDRYCTEKASSVQSAILYDCDAKALSTGSVLITPPGSPKNCPEANGGSVRVQISPSRPASVYMVSQGSVQVEISPVMSKSSLGFWPSPLRSTSCFSPRTLEDRVAYRLECSRCCMVPVIFKDSIVVGGQTIRGIFGHIGRSPSCDVGTTGLMPYRPDY
ncbi:hypothetical protein F2Q70_00036841 [Brassica cretica]|uniref:Uncharacterized protein n=1 Tax=Brassica cretica TaxID=69181 RepID=A0A8S9JSX9_BRACR|nr:hypothetical protein F2Q68_00034155 [Brassica cretica]KAF2584792.1 hypothetical protein F2Q70_00036841 [Brassica cretica]